jgi:hypothetical protein
MSMRLFDKGRQYFASGDADWDAHNFKCVQLDLTQTDTCCKAITAATNASPIVVTSAAHGYANGDIVVIRGVLGNTAANGTWQVANQAANTFELKTVKDALNSTGNAAYTSGGTAFNLTLADFVDDFNACRVSTDSSNLASKTNTNGILDAADPSFTGVNGTVHAVAIVRNVGSDATDLPIHFIDGKQQVVVASTVAAGATTLWVEPLEGPIASGVAMIFSNGLTITTSAPAVAGARSISVTALGGSGIVAGHTADVDTTGAGFPYSSAGGSVALAFAATGIVQI